ncbi:hypothetical protein FACS189490_07630 [Clostridia bacterium]|nr:hypothetical protein FACS189490_07630 [Clostridia bacterium]
MRLLGKIFLFAAVVAAVTVIAVYARNYFVYTAYDGYKAYEQAPAEYEQGAQFSAGVTDYETPEELEEWAIAAESAELLLYLKAETGEIAVLDKRTDIITYSNPQDADSDELANAVNLAAIKSQLLVDYYTADRLSGSYNSFDHAAANEDIAAESIKDGVRLIYTFGHMKSKTGIVPIYIPAERLEHFVGVLTDGGYTKEAKNITNRFRPSRDIEGFMELAENSRSGAGTLRVLNEQFELAGYTADDYAADMGASGEGTDTNGVVTVTIEYRLFGAELLVRIPLSRVTEPGTFKIASVTLLPFFGGIGEESSGYFLLPNGAGSLLRFNNGKTEADNYSQDIYGRDPLSASDYLEFENETPARLPLFGIQDDTGATVLAFIENGASLANLKATVSGKVNSYNSAYFTFTARGAGSLTMFGITGETAELPVLEPEIYAVDIEVAYCFLSEEKVGYSGMAALTREKLGLTKKTNGDIPFYADIIGGTMGEKVTLGKRYESVVAVTTFDQAREIASELDTLGVNNQRILLEGWFNGGYYHNTPKKINVIGSLGDKSGLSGLTEAVEAGNGRVYADVAFQKSSFTANDYNWQLESSQFYSGAHASVGQVNPVSFDNRAALGHYETQSNYLSPKFLPRYVGSFVNALSAVNVSGVSLRDLGDTLQSDKRREEIINRHTAEQIVVGQLEALSDSGKYLCVSGGNLYAAKYADDLVSVPIYANGSAIVDEYVPFYSMVFHGSVNLSGEPLNISGSYDRRENVLTLLENGASPRFALTYAPASGLKDTGLNRFYAAYYKNWVEEAAVVYAEVNAVLSEVSGAFVVKHEIIGALRVLTYDNGKVLVINKGETGAEYGGQTISPKSGVLL